MKQINTGTSDFQDLIKSESIYVDKTAYMHRLISDKRNKVLFISRPRRFGKTLTISALKYLFTGRRDLFRGLDIDKSDWKWRTHPVIHFRFNELDTSSVEEVRRDIAKLTVGAMADENMTWAASLGAKLLAADWPKFFVGLKSLYAHLPYGPTEESVQEFSFERVLYTLLASQGIQVVSEDRQANGRADIVAEHKRGTYIFELKVGEPVDAAFAQIREKGYADAYAASGRPVWLIGLSFDRDSRKLVECAAKSFAMA